jgi:hypothetical protein
MNQTAFDRQRVLKGKTPITILAVIALVCTVLSSITYFAFYSNDELVFRFPSFLGLISFAMYFAPTVLLILYVVKFFRAFKATIIVPIIFSCIVASPLLSFISALIGGYELDGITLITNIITIITFTLATIGALKGLSNKVFIVIPTALGLALSLLSLISVSSNLTFFARNGFTLYLFTEPMSIIASITFYVALLLLGLKNRIPAILAVSLEKEKKNAEKMTPEQSLRLLNDKLELGMITEEEYKAQRTEIINNL